MNPNPLMENVNKPLVSIVILNYNQTQVSCEFLDSAKSLTYPNYEIIMVDNASPDDPTERITKEYPEVNFIRTSQNLGFSGGNNVGIRAAKGEYFFVVNNDTEVTPDLIERLLEPFEADPLVGIVSPKIRYFSEPTMIQYAGFKEINPITGRNSTIGQHEIDNGQHDSPAFTPYAHGAAMMVKKEVVNKIGALPDEFFLYYEELDWSARARKAGYKIYYQPTALIYHKESVSTGKDSPLKAYYQNRNRILFMRRNSTKSQLIYFTMFLILFVTPKKILEYSIKGQFTHLRNYIKALVWNMQNPKFSYA